MKMKKLSTFALATAMAIGTFGISVPTKASAVVTTTDYTITIPAKLSVANAGWNETEGITAQWTKTDGYTGFDEGKRLTVTAASENTWKLMSGENSIGYNLATASADYSASATPASWQFSADELNKEDDQQTLTGTTKSMGINVEDYTQMSIPAGSYTDTVTFTAKVEDAAPAATTLDTATIAWTTGTYAVPANGLTYGDAITVNGDVTLVLTDGETITLNKGISIADGATLTVQGDGTMNVNGTSGSTASTVAGDHGTLVLTSGTLNATGGNGASPTSRLTTASAGGVAINADVTVNGGTLKATGGTGGNVDRRYPNVTGGAGGAAISGSLTITSGAVTATGGNGGNVGNTSDYSVGGSGGTAIGGDATISGGTWTATDGANGTNGSGTAGTGGKAVAGTVTDNRQTNN